MTGGAVVTALTKGRIALCLVAVGAQEICGLVQPGAGITIAVPVMSGGASSVATNVGDRGLQSVQEVRKRRVERGLGAIFVQPIAGLAEVAVATSFVVDIEIPTEMTVREIDFAFD